MGKVLLTRPIFDALETSDILKIIIFGVYTPLIEIKSSLRNIEFSEYDIFCLLAKMR